jgi:hypothetical protein
MHLSGNVFIRVHWGSDAELYLTVKNSSGVTVASGQGAGGYFAWDGSLRSGDYTVQVGEWSDTWTLFRVTIED